MLRTKLRFVPAGWGGVPVRFFHHLFLCMSLVLFLSGLRQTVSAQTGETVVYPGNALQTIFNTSNSLAPGGHYNNVVYYDNKSDSLSGNTVTVNAAITGDAFGAINTSDTSGVTNNNVIINGNVGILYTSGSVFGGFSNDANVDGNRVTLNSGTVFQNISGGASNYQGNVTNNTVTINGGTAESYVWGGVGSYNSNVSGNKVIINGGTVNLSVIGGNINSSGLHDLGTVTGNSVTMTGGMIFASPDDDNNLTKADGTIHSTVYGGSNNCLGGAENNRVTISGGTVDATVTGGYSSGGTVTKNIVTVENTGTVRNIVGGTGGTIVIGNSVIITGGTVGTTINNYVYGGNHSSNATGNSVSISGGIVNANVFGGRVYSAGSATDNTVSISGGTVEGIVAGGIAYSNTSVGSAIGNTVTISGGTVLGDIVGGYGRHADDVATRNTVTLSRATPGTLDLSGAMIFGGYVVSGGSGDAWTGNTLNVHSPDLQVAGLYNFENLNFLLPSGVQNNDVMLIVATNGSVPGSGEADITDCKVNVVMDGSSSLLHTGDRVILIDADTLTGEPMESSITSRQRRGATVLIDYDMDVITEGNQLVLILKGQKTSTDPDTENISEGYLTGTSLLNQGGDLIARQSMMSRALCAGKQQGLRGCGIFCDISGGWSRYNIGTKNDLSGMSLITGFSRCTNLGTLPLAWGLFLDYGTGSYDAVRLSQNGTPIHGYGNIHHYGGGVLGRMDFPRFGSRDSHYYTDFSFRAGCLHNGYHSNDLRDALDRAVSYRSSPAYYGMHVGVGQLWNITNRTSFDLYGKYFWTQMQGNSVTLSTGDPVEFQSVNSNRLRFGGRLTWDVATAVNTYCGAAWEHEFHGDVRATAHGYAVGVPTLRGDTGIGELGVSWKPAKYRGLYIDLGIQGYAGKRDGVAANLLVGWKR